jgi:septum formation protein
LPWPFRRTADEGKGENAKVRRWKAGSLRTERAGSATASRKRDVRPLLVLASGSPRRLQLLSQVGIEPDALRPTQVDETPNRGELPRRYALRVSFDKADAARQIVANDEALADAYILAADTVVALNRRILIKPNTVDEALEALRLLSGRAHKVYTAIQLIRPDDKVRTRVIVTRVRFKRLSSAEMDSYIASREWKDKAGGYAIQGIAAAFVRKIVGSYTNVVGLPLQEVVQMLQAEGFPVHYNWLRFSDTTQE